MRNTTYVFAAVLVWVVACGTALAESSAGKPASEGAAQVKQAEGATAVHSEDPLAFLDNPKFDQNQKKDSGQADAGFLTSLVRMIGALAIVVGVLVGVMLLLKQLLRISPQMRKLTKMSEEIEVLARGGVAKKTEVVLVRVRDRQYVLALSNERCQVIDRLGVPEIEDDVDIETREVNVKEVLGKPISTETHFNKLMNFIGRGDERKSN